MNCPECERLWATYSYVLGELRRMLVTAEPLGDYDRLRLRDLEDCRAFVREELREHALSHAEEEVLQTSAMG